MLKLSIMKKRVFGHRVGIVGAGLLSALLWFHQRFILTVVIGDSMRPTLKSGQLLVVDKNAYQGADPSRDDIVMAHYGRDLILKRIVGLPGEEVEVRRGTLFVDGAALVEKHQIEPGLLDVGRGKLLSGDFATLGDNRAVPSVLAIHPIISKGDVVGKVVRIWGWPK
jgi:signal peptidase I